MGAAEAGLVALGRRLVGRAPPQAPCGASVAQGLRHLGDGAQRLGQRPKDVRVSLDPQTAQKKSEFTNK